MELLLILDAMIIGKMTAKDEVDVRGHSGYTYLPDEMMDVLK